MATEQCKPNWYTCSARYACVASGKTEVLFIAPNISSCSPEVVPRRPQQELSEDEQRKLETQGVPRDNCNDDLSIMKARYNLDKSKSISEEMSDCSLTCELVKKKAAQLMNNTSTVGVVLYYIGAGKKGTGDWCFNDGFITFREIMDLYTTNQHFRGRVLTIVSDCSYSGSWVREAMAFMDEQGVGPCGHMAKEKGVLVKVFTSCQPNQIPVELKFSTHIAVNDKNDGAVGYKSALRYSQVCTSQHPSVVDFTQVRCSGKIDQPCTMAPESTWEKWGVQERVMTARGVSGGRPAWDFILLDDDEEKIMEYIDRTSGENTGKYTFDMSKYGEILRNGWGPEPPNDAQQWLEERYHIDYNYSPKQ